MPLYIANQTWVSVASDAEGVKMMAASSPGNVWTTIDGGDVWSHGTSPQGELPWSSVDISGDGAVAVAAIQVGWSEGVSGAVCSLAFIWRPHCGDGDDDDGDDSIGVCGSNAHPLTQSVTHKAMVMNASILSDLQSFAEWYTQFHIRRPPDGVHPRILQPERRLRGEHHRP